MATPALTEEKNGTPAKDNTRRHYEDIVKENASFEEYYKVQKVCPEEEWDTFMKTLRESLPTAFRIIGSKSEANALVDIVKGHFSEILNMKLENDGDSSEGPRKEIKPINLPWYPGGLAWQLHFSRTDIGRSEPLYKLVSFLVAEETVAGGVSRQEAVSMIPPVVLDVGRHHKVLNMCAATGSKTAQLIELLHDRDEVDIPSGFVMANYGNIFRYNELAYRRFSPCSVITRHDSAVMPNMVISDEENPELAVPLKFDRVLCDVPCSRDATFRKNANIWSKWSTGKGNNYHRKQYRILKRGIELLAVGGKLVYSTCSFNPIENEAVIHRLLQETGDSLQLEDAADRLPGLKYNKGLSYWKPASKDMVFYERFEDVPKKWRTVVRPQMFPPNPEDAAKYHLDKW